MLGVIGILKSDKNKFLMLVIPMMLMIIASGLKKFPFYERFILFLLPAAFLFISHGINVIISRGKNRFCFGSDNIFYPYWRQSLRIAIAHEINPQGQEEMRPLVDILLKDQFPGDSLFMNNSAQYAYKYYLKYYHSGFSPYKEGYFFDFTEQGRVTLILNTTPAQDVFLRVHIYRKTRILKKREYLFQEKDVANSYASL